MPARDRLRQTSRKRPARAWLDTHADPDDTIVYLGIDWTETHRIPGVVHGWKPWTVRFPMTEEPLLDKAQMLERLVLAGIEIPRAYREGMPHNNCALQGCVRGGQAYWERLLRHRPEAYARTERHEQRLRRLLDADVTILKETLDGASRPLPLVEFRRRLEAQPALFDDLDWGACSCFTVPAPDPEEGSEGSVPDVAA